MNKKKVSVIIPTKNRQELLIRSLRSVINQTYENIEIIVVDDCSDNEIQLAEMIGRLDFGVVSYKYVRNKTSMGGAKSRNIGIDASEGEYVCFLDDDDEYNQGKVKRLVEYIEDLGEMVDCVFGSIKIVEERGAHAPLKYPKKFSKIFSLICLNYIHTNATLIRRRVLDEVRFEESLPRFQDTQFHIEIMLKSRVEYLNECVALWYVDDGRDQITSNNKEKAMPRYEAFGQLIDYLENVLNINKILLSSFYVQWFIYLFKTGGRAKFDRSIPISRFLLSIFPGLIFYAIKKYAIRKQSA
jgi:glycosyltransferase involved in cell wall biosynthesis